METLALQTIVICALLLIYISTSHIIEVKKVGCFDLEIQD